ncbi:class I SAM-dependent methyltransferase [Stratiformator vulcanicus]|uniref:Ubiquinone biosynthesis O-methyltransferase n=1 Tax=Stratiformator vulcanicus TaxID=2527980 RepID=A0A517R1M4_9PLAN|nr:class I SAM-dependent methyltransferase [Stratiformator vulcanicus]QDT37805.1 Ubiquinone biosynthesis O-methyltransferase [Stratiformator vulcanicus]
MSTSPQRWNPDRYRTNAGFVADELGSPVLDLLDPQPGERILDLGCGDGALAERIVARGATVVGVDSSAEQIAAARAKGLDAHVRSATELGDDSEFDAVFTNATLHWIADHDAVLRGVAKALKPGGRFVGEFGGEGNVVGIVDALSAELRSRGIDSKKLNPWHFPSPDVFRGRLDSHRFEVVSLDHFPRPVELPTDIIGWLETFGESFAKALPVAEREGFLRAVADRSEPELRRDDGVWIADYVRLRFAAHKPCTQ